MLDEMKKLDIIPRSVKFYQELGKMSKNKEIIILNVEKDINLQKGAFILETLKEKS